MKRMKTTIIKSLFLLIALTLTKNTFSQVTIGADRAANSSAMLEVVSDTKGLLLPRVKLLSTRSYSPLSSHVKGMTVYNTQTQNDVVEGQYYNNGEKWIRLQVTDDVNLNSVIFASTDNPNLHFPEFGTVHYKNEDGTVNEEFVNDPSLQRQLGKIYIGADASIWIYNGTTYTRYTPAPSTAWYFQGTTNDAGNNKDQAISRTGKVGIGSSSIANPAKFFVTNYQWNGTISQTMYVRSAPEAITKTGTYYQAGITVYTHQKVATNIQNNGYVLGIRAESLRNGGDNGGFLKYIYGLDTPYGHAGTEITGTTETAVGVQVRPYIASGKITSSYDIYAMDYSGNSDNITNKYGLYIVGASKKNYVQGNFGVGINNPIQKLEVGGAIKLGNTSVNSNGAIRFTGTAFQVCINNIWKTIVTN